MKPRILLNILLSVVVLAVAGLLVGLLLLHCRQPARRVRPKVVPKVVAPQIRSRPNHRVEIVGFGSARPRVQLKITPQVAGIVVAKAPDFLSGRYIRKGQVLFRIDRTDYELSARRAERRIDLIKAQLSRLDQEEKNLTETRKIESGRVELAGEQLKKAVKLLEMNAGSENEVDIAREALLVRESQLQNILSALALIGPQRKQLAADIASAEVDSAQAKVNLDRCTVRSPVTGSVFESRIEVGQLVQAGGDCGQIYGTDIMEVPVSVSATDLDWLDRDLLEMCKHHALPSEPSRRIKAKVEWRQSDNGRTVTWDGCVERVEAALDAKTRNATLVVRVKNPELKRLTGNPDTRKAQDNTEKYLTDENNRILKANMFCKVTILGRKMPGVFILPRQAILPDGDVYVAVKSPPRIEFLWYGKVRIVTDYRLRKRPVVVARFTSREAMIPPGNGISDGDRVVLKDISKPSVGMFVKPVNALLSGPKPQPVTKRPKRTSATAAGS